AGVYPSDEMGKLHLEARRPSLGGSAIVRKVNRRQPDVPQRTADRGTDVIERHLAAYGVSRARELPEEGKVYLYRELSQFFSEELPQGVPAPERETRGWRGWWNGLVGRGQRA